MKTKPNTIQADLEIAREKWGPLTPEMLSSLVALIKEHQLSVSHGDLLLLNRGWYVTHAGLLRLARRKHCTGIRVSPVDKFCDPSSQRWRSREQSIDQDSAGALSATATPIPPTFRRSSAGQKCG